MAKFDKFTWSSELSIGVHEMDAQHKVLIDKINDLVGVLELDDNKLALARFDTLAGFVVKHFTEEEAYMEKIKFPGVEGHKFIHKQLLDQVGKYRVELAANTLEKAKLVGFLKLWLKSHIMGIDTKYGAHALKKAS